MGDILMESDEVNKLQFSWYDYGMFGSMFLLSILIGIYFGFIKKQTTSNEYLFGGKKMLVIPISASLISSIVSGVTLLALPTDIYTYGVTYLLCAPMLILAVLVAYFVYMPVFYGLQVTSTYEYIKLRFDERVRVLASGVFILTYILFLPIVIYIPALALSQATGISIHAISPTICIVCIFYTSFGGLKAVVWTDALQFVVMVASVLGVFILGLSAAGGIEIVWAKNLEYKRLDISLSTDPTKRDTFWTATIGVTLNWLVLITCHQGFIQKCIALPNYRAVRSALTLFAIGLILIISFTILTGLIMFAKYSDCDPLLSQKIKRPDQLLPYFIMDIGRTAPGLSGLFTAGLLSAALSTLSAAINCLSATIYEDFISKLVPRSTSQERISTYLKIVAIAVGVIATALVYVIPYMGALLPLATSLNSVAGGTLLGLFTSAVLIPAINSRGALYGGIISLISMTAMISSAHYYKTMKVITYPTLPVGSAKCLNFTVTGYSDIPEDISDTITPFPFGLFKISFHYYHLMGMLMFIIVGLIVSKLTPQCNKHLKKEWLSPVLWKFLKEEDKQVECKLLQQTDQKINICSEY